MDGWNGPHATEPRELSRPGHHRDVAHTPVLDGGFEVRDAPPEFPAAVAHRPEQALVVDALADAVSHRQQVLAVVASVLDGQAGLLDGLEERLALASAGETERPRQFVGDIGAVVRDDDVRERQSPARREDALGFRDGPGKVRETEDALGEDDIDHTVSIPVCFEHYEALEQYRKGRNVEEVRPA